MSSTPAVISAETTPVPGNPPAQLAQATPVPQTEWDVLRAQLRETPQNPDGWIRLVELAEEAVDFEQIKQSYEGLLEAYPNTVCSSPSARVETPILF